MTHNNGGRQPGDAFHDRDVDLSEALGATRPVMVNAELVGGTLREWAAKDERKQALLRELFLSHLDDGDAEAVLAAEGRIELARDLSGFFLTRLRPLELADEEVSRSELISRAWMGLNCFLRLAVRYLGPWLAEGEELEVEVELESMDVAPRREGSWDDQLSIDEAQFWAGASEPRLLRQPRAMDVNPGAARLANRADLARHHSGAGSPDDTHLRGTTPILETREDGSQLEFFFDFTLSLDRELRRRHLMVVGPTGCGKTRRVILPLLRSDIANPELSVVVIDTKGELLSAVRALVEEYRPGTEVELVQFRDPARSLGWNPLELVDSPSKAYRLAFAICTAAELGRETNDSLFWRNNSIDLLAAMILALIEERGAAASIADALDLADLGVNELEAFAQAHPRLRALRRFASYVKGGSHNAETILADLRMRLGLWRDEMVAATTSRNELDMEAIAREPRVVVLQVPEEDVQELKPLTNAWVDQLFAAELRVARASRGGVLPVQLSIFIEEFASSVGRIPKIEQRLHTCRQPGISITVSVQSSEQVRHEYQSAFRPIMAGFSTKILFADCLNEDAQWFSSLAGETTVYETSWMTEEGGEDPLLGRTAPGRRSRSERPVDRPLLTPGQLQRPPSHEVLGSAVTWFGPGCPPFQVFLPLIDDLGHGARLMGRALDLGNLGALRDEPLTHEPVERDAQSASPPWQRRSEGVTDTRGWNDGQLRAHLELIKADLDWAQTTGSARKWWQGFEEENRNRLALVVRLAEELKARRATVTDFFIAFVYSNTDNIQANLHYLDYTRLKRAEEEKKKRAVAESREQAASARGSSAAPEGIREALEQMLERGWTLAEAAEASGFSEGKLRYWRKKLDL